MTIGIAMWSGPRNISTAMMRSWENRADCRVVDEPFYACYLSETGVDHPCKEQILASMSSSRATVIEQLLEDDPDTPLFYQKQMTHHMPEQTDLSWCAELRHCFLIRDPSEVIASYLEKMPAVDADAIGIERQLSLYQEITCCTGNQPAVIDSKDVLKDPSEVLGKLCAYLEIPFPESSMLRWPTGRRGSDGVWASHWYQSVEASSGFAPYRPRTPALTGAHASLAAEMAPIYEQLLQHKL